MNTVKVQHVSGTARGYKELEVRRGESSVRSGFQQFTKTRPDRAPSRSVVHGSPLHFKAVTVHVRTLAMIRAVIDQSPSSADDVKAENKTAKQRLKAHSTEATCRNCHELSDPIGFGLEIFDGIGSYRSTENGVRIDTSGVLDGRAFANTADLGQAFHDSPLIGACLVENVYRYGVGRDPVNSERRLLRRLEKQFESSGHRLHALLRDVAMSDGFRTATRPRKAPKVEELASGVAAEADSPTY